MNNIQIYSAISRCSTILDYVLSYLVALLLAYIDIYADNIVYNFGCFIVHNLVNIVVHIACSTTRAKSLSKMLHISPDDPID